MSDDEYQRLLKQFPEKLTGVLNWRIYFQRLVQAGRRTGRTDIEIGDDIREELKGQLDDRTIRAYLPQSMKHMEKKKLSLEVKPKYEDLDPHPSPPPQAKILSHREVIEIVRQRQDAEPSKAPSKPLIKFNTDEFRRELRIALINGDTVYLQTNNSNEVISILEAKEVIKINEKAN